MKVLCVIPARYASTRLPGKPLLQLAGKPMVWRVYERASSAVLPQKTVVATDSQEIFDVMINLGGQAVMTRADHPTGTDRLAEVAQLFPEYDLIVNVQGDEPLIEPCVIDQLAQALIDDDTAQMATCMNEMDEEEYNNPAAVKVVTDVNGNALYFSRSILPYPRNKTGYPVYKHIGIYAYRRDFLIKYAQMAPTPLEQTESLEQLRALENSYKIKVIKVPYKFYGVDTLEDFLRVEKILCEQ
ncbi:MAG: 3-deoxy-manno-octulosonate cytidylyltransferase [Negativicutes bacterium]|jgi:3-deoxy-manno-octulosonate cytidylyltransferase (CMP-KDO synthetase)